MNAPLPQVVGLVGSLREGSHNGALLDAIAASCPAMRIRTVPIAMPLFNADLEMPAQATALHDAIRAADGVLIVSPEYNYGIPGALKNAIDWASRPAYQSVFRDKKVAVASASPGPGGGVRMQAHLKTVLLGMAAHVFPWPELGVARVHQVMDEQGSISDERLQAQVQAFAEAFAAFISRP